MYIRNLLLTVCLLVAQTGLAAGVGEPAPAFELQTIDGETVHLSDYKGKKAVFLTFWNTWCEYCIKKTPRYKKLEQAFGDRVEILAVNTTWSDTLEETRRYQEDYETNYPLAFDTGEVITKRYDVHVVPTEFIIGVDGIIRYRNGVPEYIAAHVPDWFEPYTPDMNPDLSCSNPDAS